MTSAVEDRQRLNFDDSWHVLKWDGAAEFVKGMQSSLHHLDGGLKAVDVVGVRTIPRRERTLLVAEFKDFDHPRVPEANRGQVARDAVSDVVLGDILTKVIHSLAGATFAHDDQQRRSTDLAGWRPALGRSTTTMLVLICVEVPASQSVAHLAWTKKLQQRLRWLGPGARVVVTTSARPFAGLGITYTVP